MEDEPWYWQKSNMAAVENMDGGERNERLKEQEKPSLSENQALLVDI